MNPVGLVAGVALALCGQATGTELTRTFNVGSVATCDVRAVSKSSSLSVSVAERAAEKIDAVLCGPDAHIDDDAASSAHAVATAFAEAVTEVAAECYAKGVASFKVKGKSVASAQAHAIAQAYASAYATAKTCHKCSAAAELLVESYDQIFLNATSESTIELEAIAAGAEISDATSAFTRSFLEQTVVAFAEVLLDARAAVDSCEVSAITKTEAGDIDATNESVCKIGVVAADDEKISNGAVAIATSVSAKACGKGFTSATFEVEAEALGKVMSIAVSEISGTCYVKGKGTACILGDAHMTKTAQAVATAFASGYAAATNDCGKLCHADTAVVSEAVGYVLATATSDVYKKQCDGADSYFDIEVMDKEIVEATTEALASILTSVTVLSDGDCIIEVEVDTSVTPGSQKIVPDHAQPYDDEHISEPHPHHDAIHSVEPHPHYDEHDKPKDPDYDPVKKIDETPKGRRHQQSRKPKAHLRRKHGKVNLRKTATHHDNVKRIGNHIPKKRADKKRTAKKTKLIKQRRPITRPARGKIVKVRPSKQRLRAIKLAMARKRKASKGKKPGRHGKANRQRRDRRQDRSRRRPRKARRSRKPRQG